MYSSVTTSPSATCIMPPLPAGSRDERREQVRRPARAALRDDRRCPVTAVQRCGPAPPAGPARPRSTSRGCPSPASTWKAVSPPTSTRPAGTRAVERRAPRPRAAPRRLPPRARASRPPAPRAATVRPPPSSAAARSPAALGCGRIDHDHALQGAAAARRASRCAARHRMRAADDHQHARPAASRQPHGSGRPSARRRARARSARASPVEPTSRSGRGLRSSASHRRGEIGVGLRVERPRSAHADAVDRGDRLHQAAAHRVERDLDDLAPRPWPRSPRATRASRTGFCGSSANAVRCTGTPSISCRRRRVVRPDLGNRRQHEGASRAERVHGRRRSRRPSGPRSAGVDLLEHDAVPVTPGAASAAPHARRAAVGGRQRPALGVARRRAGAGRRRRRRRSRPATTTTGAGHGRSAAPTSHAPVRSSAMTCSAVHRATSRRAAPRAPARRRAPGT